MIKKYILGLFLVCCAPLLAAPVESGFYTVIRKNIEFDPYEGNYIDQYILTLDNESDWYIDWFTYESKKLNIQVDDPVEVKQLSEKKYLLFITKEDGTLEVVRFKGSHNRFHEMGSWEQ